MGWETSNGFSLPQEGGSGVCEITDAYLKQCLSTEATKRTSAIQQAMDAEIINRNAAIDAKLSNESTLRSEKDLELNEKLDTLITDHEENSRFVEVALNVGDSVTLSANTPIDIFLNNFRDDLLPKIFINGLFYSYPGKYSSISGSTLTFTPPNNITNASVVVTYSAPVGTKPLDPSIVEFEITTTESNTLLTNFISIIGASDGNLGLVDWGDSHIDTLTIDTVTSSYSHTYINPGVYKIKITEDYGQILNCKIATTLPYVTKLITYRGNSFTTLANTFLNQTNLTTFKDGFKFETPNVVSLVGLFKNCGFETVPEGIFSLLINVIDASTIFDAHKKLKSLPTGTLSFPIATSMNAVCRGCIELTSLSSGLINTPKLTAAALLFSGCTALPDVPRDLLSSCSDIITANGMFQSCTSLKILYKELFSGKSKLTNIDSLCYLSGIETIEDGAFDGMSTCIKMTAVFRNTPIKALPIDLLKDCIAAEDFSNFCAGTAQLTTSGIGLFDNCLNTKTLYSAFSGSVLLNIDINDLIRVPLLSVTDVSRMFYCATASKIRGNGNTFLTKFPSNPTNSLVFKNATSLSDYVSLPIGTK